MQQKGHISDSFSRFALAVLLSILDTDEPQSLVQSDGVISLNNNNEFN